MQSVSITNNVVSLNPDHGEVHSIQHYKIKFVSDLQRVIGFLQVFWFPPSIKLTEILSKVKWNTINHTLTSYPGAWYIQTLYFHFSRVNTTDNLLSTMTFVICHLPNNVVPNERWWQWHMYDGYWFILGFFFAFYLLFKSKLENHLQLNHNSGYLSV
jgi:hypothetical protein